jgi:hypothetical protein
MLTRVFENIGTSLDNIVELKYHCTNDEKTNKNRLKSYHLSSVLAIFLKFIKGSQRKYFRGKTETVLCLIEIIVEQLDPACFLDNFYAEVCYCFYLFDVISFSFWLLNAQLVSFNQ